MGQYDFTYSLPTNFDSRVKQLLAQQYGDNQLLIAFEHCKYEFEDIGNAYYAGMKGDNWDKHALDFTFEGDGQDIEVLKSKKKTLDNAIQKALKSSESGFLLHNMFFLISNYIPKGPTTNDERLNADVISAKLILDDLLKVSERLCSNYTYGSDSSENSINDFFRDTLSLMGYAEVKDQTRHGVSGSGKDAGEVDILITKDNKEIAIFEGLKLSSVDSSYIDNHIEKAIKNYNAMGTATFIVAYVSSLDYEAFWKRLLSFLKSYDFSLTIKQALKENTHPNAAARVANMILSRDGFDFPVYFIALRLSH